MEIHSVYLHASLGNHVACHRAVDAAGQQQHGSAVGSHRHASWSGNHQGKQVDSLAHLHMKNHIRVMDVHAHLGKRFQNHLSHVAVNLLRGHGILLIPPAGIYLEGDVLIRINLVHVLHHMFFQVLVILILNLHHGADIRNAEYPLKGLHRIVVIIVRLCLHVDAP